ncbi:HlyD family type I secretion periplasmic adaptor subunit [Azospirillum sp. sgz301742]
MTTSLPAWQTALASEMPEPSLRRLVVASLLTIGVGFGSFFGWAFTAPLDSAVPANGSIVVQSKRKTVSLLDSGILKEILVHEGDRVEAGQVLLRLDETQALAQLGQLKAQYWAAVSRATRLRAEQADRRTLDLPPDLAAATADRTVAAIVENERRLFEMRWQTYDNTLAVQRKRVSQLNEQIAALRAQTTSATTRLSYVREQLKGVRELLVKGYAPRNRALELQGMEAELTGSLGEYTSHEAEARENIIQAEYEVTRIESSWKSDVVKDLQDTQALLNDLAERLRGATDTLQHKDVTAPEAGTVTDIKFFTPGSSIGAGQPVLDIVPNDDRLLVEVPVTPNDIEHVHLGQSVNVRLTSYKQHKVPVLTGKLTYVSADRQTDARGEPFFLARAELDPDALSGLKGVALYPGMPAEVLIIGGERLAIDYFISPITDSLHRALHED